VATGLIMPALPDGQYKRPAVSAGSPNYIPWRAGTEMVQPGHPLGDAAVTQPDALDDEMLSSVEVGVVAIPHFPRERWTINFAHHWEAVPRVKYTQQAAQYTNVILPEPVGDQYSAGLPPEGDEVFSQSDSEGEYDATPTPIEARPARPAHQVNQVMSDSEVSESGATGVWSIAGRV
jgi:hypothetical protein